MTPKSSSLTLISRSAVARTVPSSIGTSYDLPVRLSVIVSESEAEATPPPVSLCSSVPTCAPLEGEVNLYPHCGGRGARRALRRDDRGEHRPPPEQRARQHDGARGALAGGEGLVADASDGRQDQRERHQEAREDVERRLGGLGGFFGGLEEQQHGGREATGWRR